MNVPLQLTAGKASFIYVHIFLLSAPRGFIRVDDDYLRWCKVVSV